MPAPWIQTVLIELSKKLNHYWYSEPRTWKTCLFYIVLGSHDTNKKNSSFFETILQYALTYLFNRAADQFTFIWSQFYLNMLQVYPLKMSLK